ncbi:hypothetical protein [Haloarcula sp. CGMCC 1.2071]|uniref:hypothetical protein n=1 Tax=Haloarcula sp. CGMCC 1.2071 TaxID=3111454 RepID=UPI00300F1B6B
MSDASIPLVPIDPREVGPVTFIRLRYRALRSVVLDNAPWAIVSTVALVALLWHFEVSVPEVPDWVLVGAISMTVASGPAALLGWRLGAGLWSPETVLISVQNPESGNQRLMQIEPDRFNEMTVINNNGKRRGSDFLKAVRINGSRAYEVDSYDADRNIAVASWQAGVTNSEIRRDRAEIRNIKTSLEEEADKALELLANHPNILRKQAREVSNRLIRVAEGVEVPEGGQLHERLSDMLDESDPSDQLLGSNVEDEPDEDGGSLAGLSEDEQDIFERAAHLADGIEQQSNGHEEVSNDDD